MPHPGKAVWGVVPGWDANACFPLGSSSMAYFSVFMQKNVESPKKYDKIKVDLREEILI